MLHVDVTDDETITRAAAEVESRHGRLDILVNNAAVGYVKGTLREQMRLSFDTNATSALILGSAFAPLLQKSNDARIINISSGMGSITRRLDALSPMYKVQATTYRVSKAALNMITACQVAEYGDQGVRVFAYDPGFTVSNLSENNKEEKGARKVEDSVRPLVDVLEGRRDGEMGKLLHNEGSYEW
jgi:NAD(P)-dependent dehydrogenase (short-subunit alcohol dehydrogenase family)